MLKNKHIVLGVSGSIASYKACELTRRLKEKGARVICVLTPGAAHFVSPLTLSVLSGERVYTDPFDPAAWEMAHLSLADRADVIVIAPASAETLARLAQGHSAILLDAVVLAATCPVVLCPAMDEVMWKHKATQENVRRLKSFGYRLLGPEKGSLASGKVGWGRLSESETIIKELEKIL